jgi:hypothetical protein
MSRKLVTLDRIATLLLAALLIGGGLAALDWRYRWVLSYPDRTSTRAPLQLTTAGWWPWAAGAVGVVLILLGLWWLLAHLRRGIEPTLRLPATDPTGRITADLASLADAAADDFQSRAPVDHVRGTARRIGSDHVIEIRAHVDPRADGDSITRAARSVTGDVERAFPNGSVSCRILLDSPRAHRGLRRAPATARVH